MSLDDYRLTEQIGAGRDGVSYRAEARDAHGTVELIRLDAAHDDRTRWAALCRRLALASRVEHPAARRLIEFVPGPGTPFVVLPLNDGPTLFQSVSDRSPLGRREPIATIRTLAELLATAHRLGLPHGHLDPWSVRVGHDMTLSVDFTGLDCRTDSGVGETRLRTSHDAFQAPEYDPEVEPVAEWDIFSLGRLAAWLIGAQEKGSEGSFLELVERMTDRDPFARPVASAVAHRLASIPGDPPPPRDETAPDLTAAEATSAWSRRAAESTEAGRETAQLRLTGAATSPGVRDRERGERPESLGRFRIVERLGAGGMGEVYKAVDEADGSVVAVKILHSEYAARPNALLRFRKEARLLARVRNPYVANLLEVNEDRGCHYIVLEYVAGESIDRSLASRKTLDEPTAVAVAADVARGLMDAHRLGIVHRDVKPSNILVTGDLSRSDGDGPRVKLADFGLARQTLEEESQVLTQSGVVVGTPAYMAPEQCSGGSVDPRADVYALGATLFHLVAGRPPFVADDWRVVIARHMNEPPPPLRELNPRVSEGLARVVGRALAKSPEDRYADAESLLLDLERLRNGEPTGLPVHPVLPAAEPGKVLAFDFSWELDAPPRRLWPYVANTDRLDRALGFGAVRYALKFDPARGVRRFLQGRKAGMAEEGEEHPYEWVEGRRLGVLREYARGPFIWVVSVVELAPRAGGGTTLTHRLRVEPRGRLIRLASNWGIGSRLNRDLERVYRRIDAALNGRLGSGPAHDPFESPAELPAPRRRRLDDLLTALAERGVRADVVEALGTFLAEAPAPELARIRPRALARRLGLEEDAVVDACLHAASVGLLVLLWDLLCPVCRLASEVKDTLRAIADHGRCEACQADFVLDFANSVELVFRSHPQVREADTNTYCAAGPAHSPHVVAQVRLAPGERMELSLGLDEGIYRLRGPQLGWELDFLVRRGEPARRWDVKLAHAPSQRVAPTLGVGAQVLVLTNDADGPLVVRVERVAARDDALTAARASARAVFRDLFPGEVLAPGRLVSVTTATFLLTDLDQGARSLYQELGDPRAFRLLHEQLRRVDAAVRGAGGAVVKTVGEGVLAAFPDAGSAVRAGFEISRQPAEGDAAKDLVPRLRIVAHSGPAMAATVNDHLDYFGATLHETFQVIRRTRAGSFALTRPVASDPEVAASLAALGVVGRVTDDVPDGSSYGPVVHVDIPVDPSERRDRPSTPRPARGEPLPPSLERRAHTLPTGEPLRERETIDS